MKEDGGRGKEGREEGKEKVKGIRKRGRWKGGGKGQYLSVALLS